MKLLIFFSCFLVCSLAIPNLSKWNEWKQLYGRNYASKEDLRRQKIFINNLKMIKLHNKKADAGYYTYRLAVNQFADMTHSEFVSQMNLKKQNPFNIKKRNHNFMRSKNNTTPPPSFDWRTSGKVAPVKDMAGCRASYAFSATAVVESAHAIKTGNLTVLSEQNIIDCSYKSGNLGCADGYADQGFDYVIYNSGIDTNVSYPYDAELKKCRFKKEGIGATISYYDFLPYGDEQEMTSAIETVGPVSVIIDAYSPEFQFYSSGVYIDDKCSSDNVNLSLVVVGYDSLDGQDYWIVRNAWGTEWGIDGYIWMARNRDNMCGIASIGIYVLA